MTCKLRVILHFPATEMCLFGIFLFSFEFPTVEVPHSKRLHIQNNFFLFHTLSCITLPLPISDCTHFFCTSKILYFIVLFSTIHNHCDYILHYVCWNESQSPFPTFMNLTHKKNDCWRPSFIFQILSNIISERALNI